MMYQFSKLEDDKLAAIRALEEEVGTPLVAYQKVDATCARLDRDALAKIQKLEDDLGVVLLAQTA